jgi:hypothetical protein
MSTQEGKGRPTPKRKEAESKRKVSSLSPVVTKDQKQAAKAQARKDRHAQRDAYLRGEDSALPLRDRGPARRFVRNYVDSRRSTGEYFLPAIFVVLILTYLTSFTSDKNTRNMITAVSIAMMYGMLFIAVIDGILLTRKLRKEVAAQFPGTETKGLGMYAWLRSTQMRRLRAPHPQVKISKKKN